MSDNRVYLEAADGSVMDVVSPFTIGRSESASLIIDDEKASRIHAQLHCDPEESCWWVTDLQSTNGTYLNGVRVREATPLNTGDRIHIGNKAWIFHAPAMVVSPKRSQPGIRTTITSVTATHCWLLLADVVGSTQLLDSVGPKSTQRV